MEQICSSLNVEISEKNETELTNWIQFIHIRHRAVSYTHLDVYKRQEFIHFKSILYIIVLLNLAYL
uniref:Uncharacterized protein n=1 Tax=Candidatus Enterococcus dunnyi TaxID=1834192 RepID=A0A200J1R4_9ENTE|nr:hypothetical protein A5889_002868 [Enterococcus sp. 9D6_DIV0238]